MAPYDAAEPGMAGVVSDRIHVSALSDVEFLGTSERRAVAGGGAARQFHHRLHCRGQSDVRGRRCPSRIGRTRQSGTQPLLHASAAALSARSRMALWPGTPRAAGGRYGGGTFRNDRSGDCGLSQPGSGRAARARLQFPGIFPRFLDMGRIRGGGGGKDVPLGVGIPDSSRHSRMDVCGEPRRP